MAIHVETELKLKLVDPESWRQLLESPLLATLGSMENLCQETLESQYFDTPSRGLQKSRLAYRIRLEGGCWLATLKAGGTSGGGLHSREEYTIILPDSTEPATEPFFSTPVGDRLREALNGEALLPLLITRFTRYKQDLVTPDGSRVELAIDMGEIVASGKQAPIAELELELKEGSPVAVLALGAALARQFPLLVEPRSKFYRGLELAGLVAGVEPDVEPDKHAQASLHGHEPVSPAVTKLLTVAILAAFSAQELFLQRPEDPESLHRLRIAIRRLRSLLSFAKSLLATAEYEVYQEALRRWSCASGETRELDVTTAAWQELLDSGYVIFPGQAWLGEVLAQEREQAIRKFHASLLAGSSTPLLLELWSWLASGAVVAAGEQPTLKEFARGRLCSWLEDLLAAAGDNFPLSDTQELHILRIKGKKLRYMLEALANLSGRRTGKLINRLKKLQDCLGHNRDVHLTAALLNGWLQTRSSRALHRDSGLLMGWQAHAASRDQDALLRSWEKLRKVARHWLEGKSACEKV